MARPTARVLALLELLQAHRRMTGAELALRLEVDGRTVRRYVALLQDIGIPLTAERGRDGAYMLIAGFKLPPMMFTDDEALALSVGLVAARGLGLASAITAASSAQAKLERVMPDALKRRARAVDETVTLELSRPTPPVDNAALAALTAAAQSRDRVRMHYRPREGGVTERAFDAYGLAYRAGRWYAVGWCHLRGGLRSFRLDRVEDVRRLDVSFERPERFDALAHLTTSIARLPRAHAAEILLATDLATARRELFPVAGVLEPVDAGVVLHAQADDLHWLARELARLPFAFTVRSPRALRAAVASLARRLARQAGGANGSR
jgi:predicted DNA-binding transcriptional regulator YafY